MIPLAMLIGMISIVWFGADRSARKQMLLPPSYVGMPMIGEPNPYLGKMCRVGAVLALPIGLVAGLLTYLSALSR